MPQTALLRLPAHRLLLYNRQHKLFRHKGLECRLLTFSEAYPQPKTIPQHFLQVEALTLRREDGTFEAACNLLRPRETTPALVLAAAEKRGASLGIRVVDHYETGLSEKEAVSAVSRLFPEER